MGITNKAISTKFLNIIIRTNHGQTEIVMQYGSLWSSVTCLITSCSNDIFASPTHRTNQRWIKACWMLFYSCTSASRSSCNASGAFWRRRTRLLSSSNNSSIGDISGDNVGQGRTRMWFWFRNSWQTPATWHLALSWWKTWSKFRCCSKHRTIGSRISSLYFTAFNVPWTMLSWVWRSRQIPAQTITRPPPKQWDSHTHWSVKRAQRLRYTDNVHR